MREVGWIKSLSFTWAGVQPQNSSPKTRSHERKKIARRRIIHTSLSPVGAERRAALPATVPPGCRCTAVPAGTCQRLPGSGTARCLCPSEGRCPAAELLVSAAGVRGGGVRRCRHCCPTEGARGRVTTGSSQGGSAALPPSCPHGAAAITTQPCASQPSRRPSPPASPGAPWAWNPAELQPHEGFAAPSQTVCNACSSAPGQV